MLLTNHVLTGILLGLTIDDKLLLAPAGVGSHLFQDMIPHVGWEKNDLGFRDLRFLFLGTLDFIATVVVTVAACNLWPERTANILVGVFFSALPDLTYIPQIIFEDRWAKWVPWSVPLHTFLSKIQWYERPFGFFTEVSWAYLMLITLQRYLP